MPAQYQRVKRQDPASSEGAATSAPAASSEAPASSEAAPASSAAEATTQGKSISRLVAERHRVTPSRTPTFIIKYTYPIHFPLSYRI